MSPVLLDLLRFALIGSFAVALDRVALILMTKRRIAAANRDSDALGSAD